MSGLITFSLTHHQSAELGLANSWVRFCFTSQFAKIFQIHFNLKARPFSLLSLWLAVCSERQCLLLLYPAYQKT